MAASEEQIQAGLAALFENYWILRSENPELYHELRRNEKELKRIIDEKFGLRLFVHTQFIKLEKIPTEPKSWMGIADFQDKMDYTMFACALAFLETKEQNDYFLLSHLIEDIKENYPDPEALDWTNYRHRLSLVRVVNQLLHFHLMDRIEGDVSRFAQDEASEALYRVTLYARYFMRAYPQDIYQYADWHELITDEMGNIDTHGRRWEVYRRLMMEPSVVRTLENNDQLFNYIRVQRKSIEDFFERYTPFNFELTKDAAMLTATERKQMYTLFPSQQAIDDILLQLAALVRDRRPPRDPYGQAALTIQEWLSLVQELQQKVRAGWSKEFRAMSADRLSGRLLDEAERWQLIERREGRVILLPALVRFRGRYNDDFKKKVAENDE
ncbi:TIGR02678 family protein [Sporolactobacillus sp. THM7-7]|nr:TIGR02678 family protein [Sporolactobacillus sp. THM7-7]